VYKPVAAHNLWYSPRTIRKSIELGVLVGNDVSLYYDYGLMPNPAIGNPIALATTPVDPGVYLENLNTYYSELENIYSILVLSRKTSCLSNTIIHNYYPENTRKLAGRTKRLVLKLARYLKAVESNIGELNEYMSSRRIEEELDKCLEEYSRGIEVVLVESFNDAVAPYLGILDKIIALGVVAPSRILVYTDIEVVKEIVEEAVSSMGWEGLRTKHLVEKTKPSFTIETTPISKPGVRREHELFVKHVVST